jgi:hypothetical protein
VSFASIDSQITKPHYRRPWRNDDGSVHATVALGESTLYFGSAEDARAAAEACTEAAEALDRLAAGGAEGPAPAAAGTETTDA